MKNTICCNTKIEPAPAMLVKVVSVAAIDLVPQASELKNTAVSATPAPRQCKKSLRPLRRHSLGAPSRRHRSAADEGGIRIADYSHHDAGQDHKDRGGRL